MSSAIVLSGGGARAAYQIGVLRRIAELSSKKQVQSPFSICTGTSAGAVNVTILASRFDNFPLAVRALERVWANWEVHQVYRTDILSLARMGTLWMRDLGFGGFLGTKHLKSFLDTKPLVELLSRVIAFKNIENAINGGGLKALAITAASYSTGEAITFVHGVPGIEPWERTRRVGILTKINLNHVLASSAIPLLFPAIKIDGEYYGDGSIRSHTPFSPAAHLGAKKILAVGVRHGKGGPPTGREYPYPSIGKMISSLMNSIFLDNMDTDWENMMRVNELLKHCPTAPEVKEKSDLVPIECCLVRPSEDLGAIALDYHNRLPATIRYFLGGLGVDRKMGADLTSYLLFHRDYTRTLIAMGYKDACKADDEIASILEL